MSAAILVRSAGLDWSFEVESDGAREELAAWLGPRARAPGDAHAELRPGGVISMIEADGFAVQMPGTRRRPEGFVVRSREYEIRVAEEEGRTRAEVRYRNGSAAAAARHALRVVLIRSAFARGGLALHAASVRTGGGVLVFVGPVGAGKSTAAGAFPKRARLDDDLVLVLYDDKSRRWVRLDRFEEYAPKRCERNGAGELPVRAVLLPEPGEAFHLAPLRGREAFVGCLQLPFFACPPDDPRAAEELRPVMARVEKFCADVPVRQLVWNAGEDLPALLARAL